MQLTRYTDISLRVLMHLELEAGELCTIKDIASLYNVSKNHLVKVVHHLVNLGYLKSTQGRGGGIALAIPSTAINVGQVVRQMENTLEMIDCAGVGCPLTPSCLLKEVLDEATKSFLKVLDKYTVADLVKNRSELLILIG